MDPECPVYNPKLDASVDAALKQLHAHDHEQYVSHPARSPFEDMPKAAATEPNKIPAQ